MWPGSLHEPSDEGLAIPNDYAGISFKIYEKTWFNRSCETIQPEVRRRVELQVKSLIRSTLRHISRISHQFHYLIAGQDNRNVQPQFVVADRTVVIGSEKKLAG